MPQQKIIFKINKNPIWPTFYKGTGVLHLPINKKKIQHAIDDVDDVKRDVKGKFFKKNI